MSTPDRLTDEEPRGWTDTPEKQAWRKVARDVAEALAETNVSENFVAMVFAEAWKHREDVYAAARLAAQPPEPPPCANCSGADDPHPPGWQCSGCGTHVDVMPTTTSAQPPATAPDALVAATGVRLFTADEVVEMANEASDSFGNLYRLDFIDRMRHEAALAARPAPDTLAARVQADDLADALAGAWPHLFNDGFAAEVAAFVMETIGGKS